jgi:hypothetical protein
MVKGVHGVTDRNTEELRLLGCYHCTVFFCFLLFVSACRSRTQIAYYIFVPFAQLVLDQGEEEFETYYCLTVL